jgi:hypothetical protein
LQSWLLPEMLLEMPPPVMLPPWMLLQLVLALVFALVLVLVFAVVLLQLLGQVMCWDCQWQLVGVLRGL